MRPQRGFTFVTFLMLVAVAGALFWVFTYGEAYWDNFGVKRLVREAANQAYRDPNDENIRDVFMSHLHQEFDQEVMDHGRMVRQLRFDADRDEIRIERSQQPAVVHIWFTYSRTVKVPLIGGEREVTFTDHAEQDLTPVKW